MPELDAAIPDKRATRSVGARDSHDVAARPRHGTGTAVALQGVTKRFDGGVVAAEDVNLLLPAGQTTVLVGPSGCGKTTLLRIIAGFEAPSAGSVTIGGRSMAGVDPQDRGVAMVFQDYALYPDKTARANIEFPLRRARVPADERRARVEEIARLLRITDQLDRKPGQLSGGQKQRVGIGRALVRNPRVLLMDEPLSNLDAQLRGDMRAEILALQRRLGVTMVYVTHDQAEALTLADQVVVLRDGRVEQLGSPIDVYRTPATSFVAQFLGGMNLITGRVRLDSLITAAGHELRLPSSRRADEGQLVVLGVRAEELVAGAATEDELAVAGDVRLSEFLGIEQLVHVDIGSTILRAHLPAGATPNRRLSLRAPAGAVHLFCAETGERISPRPAESQA